MDLCDDMIGDGNVSDEHMKWIFHFGARPLWKYLKEVLDIDISEVCSYVTKEDKFIETEGYKLIPCIVQLPHSNEAGDARFSNDVIFLLNSINTVFQSLKMLVQRNDEYILRGYSFSIDDDKNLFLVDSDSNARLVNKAIAIVLK